MSTPQEEFLAAIDAGKKKQIKELAAQAKVKVDAKNEAGETSLIHTLGQLIDGRISSWSSQGHNGRGEFVEYKIINGQFFYIKEKTQQFFPTQEQKMCAKMSWCIDGQHEYYNRITGAITLIECKANVEAKDGEGNTALLRTAALGEPRIIAAILKKKPKLDTKNKLGETALHKAAASARLDGLTEYVTKAKIKELTVRDKAGWTPAHHCAFSGEYPEMIAFLIEQGIDLSAASKADKNDIPAGATALDVAKAKGHKALIELLDEDADVDVRQAAFDDKVQVVKKYLENGGDPELKGDGAFPALLAVAQENQVEMVELLVKHGANVNAVQEDNFTPLMLNINSLFNKGPRIAAFDSEYFDHVKIAEILIDNGTDLSLAKDGSNQKALRDAAEVSEEITKMIVDRLKRDSENLQEELDHQDSEGFTALHVAARVGNVKTLEALVKAGANVNMAEDYGFTPLHEAIIARKISAAKYLIESGADVKQKITMGYDAFSTGDDAKAIATKQGLDEIAKLC